MNFTSSKYKFTTLFFTSKPENGLVYLANKYYVENRLTRHLTFIQFLAIKMKVVAMNLFI